MLNYFDLGRICKLSKGLSMFQADGDSQEKLGKNSRRDFVMGIDHMIYYLDTVDTVKRS